MRAHYFNDKPGVAPRFSMGCGAIFMIHRVSPPERCLTSGTPVSATDPGMLEEMVSLVVALKLDVISLAEMQRRLMAGDLSRRFVCFTFDGAYRSVRDSVLPLFRKRGLPFAVYAATDFLDGDSLPWWLSLEVLLKECDKLSLEFGPDREEIRCRSYAEKQEAYARLYRRLAKLERSARVTLLEAALKKYGVDHQAAAARELLSRDELNTLAQSSLVTIGSQGGGGEPLSELSYDRARQSVEQSLDCLEAASGARPRHFAYPGGARAKVTARDVRIARDLGLETAVTGIEGALWPEHSHEMLALPRIAHDNDPAILARALMLSGGSSPGAGLSLGSASG